MTKSVDAPSRKAKDDSDRRADVRIGMLLLATIKFDDMLPSKTSRVLDLSGSGIRTILPVKLKRGHPVRVILKGVGELRAKIAWIRKAEAGIKFATALVPRPGFHIR